MNKSLSKALDILEALAKDNGSRSLETISREIGLPLPTAFRMVRTLADRDYLVQGKKGRYFAGPALHKLAAQFSVERTVAGLARPLLDQLSRRYKCVAHFGIFEADMVTYLVRTGRDDTEFSSPEGSQLEAYCSAIGKILLAELPVENRERYLSSGPFIALTDRTITDPVALRERLKQAKEDGYAIDDREIYDSLYCVAVPVRFGKQGVIGSLSLSMSDYVPSDFEQDSRISALHEVAATIANHLA